MTGEKYIQKVIHFIKIFNNFEKYCIYDSKMEFNELHEKLELQKQQPKMFTALYGKLNEKIHKEAKS